MWRAKTVHDGPHRTVIWDQRADHYLVQNESGELLGQTQIQPGGVMSILHSNGDSLPQLQIQKGWLSRYKHVILCGQRLRPVMMLEGRIRVFGNDLIRIEHRDFKSDVTYICASEMELGALVLSFMLFSFSFASSEA